MGYKLKCENFSVESLLSVVAYSKEKSIKEIDNHKVRVNKTAWHCSIGGVWSVSTGCRITG